MDAPDHIVVEMSIASAQEDERIKAIEFDSMTDQATKYGFDTNIQYDETEPPLSVCFHLSLCIYPYMSLPSQTSLFLLLSLYLDLSPFICLSLSTKTKKRRSNEGGRKE